MVDVAKLVEKGRGALSQVKPVDQAVMVGDEVVIVRVWALSGVEWRLLKAKFPPRTEQGDDGKQKVVAADARYGFDLDGVVAAYPRVKIVDGETEQDVTRDEWAAICEVLDGPYLDALAMVIWGKNEFEPNQRLIEAGKALRAGPRKKRA